MQALVCQEESKLCSLELGYYYGGYDPLSEEGFRWLFETKTQCWALLTYMVIITRLSNSLKKHFFPIATGGRKNSSATDEPLKIYVYRYKK